MDVVCETCGNEIAPESRYCPFCGSQQSPRPAGRGYRCKEINLEAGRPTVDEALVRLDRELAAAVFAGVRVLKVIHGYGSSGHGGAIRTECRKVLDYKAARGEIEGVLAGEEFTSQNPAARRWLQRCPQLADSSSYNRGNRGITLVFLR